MSPPTPTPDASSLFKRHFGHAPSHLVRVPAVLELLGSAAIDPAGLSLAVAVDKPSEIASAARSDGKIELVFGEPPRREVFWMSEFRPNPGAAWADPVKAVLDQLRRRRVHFSGFSAAISTPLPRMLPRPEGSAEAPEPAVGVAAGLKLAAALTVRRLHPFSLTEAGATLPPKPNRKGELPLLPAQERMFFAALCQAADRDFLGRETTALEPVTLLFGKAWHALSVDLASRAVEQAPLIGEVFVSCMPQTKSPGVFDAARVEQKLQASCQAARLKLGAKALRVLERKTLDANKPRLSVDEYNGARYLLEENQRVVAAERALREDDHRQFGQYLLQSYESWQALMNSGSPEQKLLIEIARAHPGCLGARANGSGTLNLVAFHHVENFMAQVSAEFQKHAALKVNCLLCRAIDGANGAN